MTETVVLVPTSFFTPVPLPPPPSVQLSSGAMYHSFERLPESAVERGPVIEGRGDSGWGDRPVQELV